MFGLDLESVRCSTFLNTFESETSTTDRQPIKGFQKFRSCPLFSTIKETKGARTEENLTVKL